MVTPQQEEILRVFYLIGKKQYTTFNAKLPTVHIIPQKQVICFRGVSTFLQKSQQIVELAVNITFKFEKWVDV